MSTNMGEVWALEPDYLFPMYKSSDIARIPLPTPQRWMLVTQKTVGESTAPIRMESAQYLALPAAAQRCPGRQA